jgi:hypothetical protein
MRVVTFPEELQYFAKTSQPLKDIAHILLDTGLHPDEAFRIRVENTDFVDRAIFNPFGKTKAARRKVTMTADIVELLKQRTKKANCPFVFAAKGSPDRPIGSVRRAHDAAVEKSGIKEHFRLYDLRPTFARFTRSLLANGLGRYRPEVNFRVARHHRTTIAYAPIVESKKQSTMPHSGSNVVDKTPKPKLNVRRSHYDANYSNFQTSLYEQIRRDAFGEDIGQNSWLTATELDTFQRWLDLSPGKTLLDVGCGAGGPALRGRYDWSFSYRC